MTDESQFPPRRRTATETGRLGDEIYERDIRPRVEETNHGKIVAINVDSGDYDIGNTGLAASERLLAQNPNADIWCIRIGYGALRSFGAGPWMRAG